MCFFVSLLFFSLSPHIFVLIPCTPFVRSSSVLLVLVDNGLLPALLRGRGRGDVAVLAEALLGLALTLLDKGRVLGDGLGHDLLVAAGLRLALLEERQALLDLLVQLLAEDFRGLVHEAVDAGGEGALVGEVARDAALVGLRGARDERAVEDEAVLGGVALLLEGTEEGLLGAKNLDRRGGGLGEVREGTGVADQTGGDALAEDVRQVGGDELELVAEVLLQTDAVLGKVNDLLGVRRDVDHVDLADLGTHRRRGLLHDHGSLLLVVEDLGNGGGVVLGVLGLAVADDEGDLGVEKGLRDLLGELGEVPAVPLLDAHAELVDALVHVVEESDRLDDHVVGTMDVELDLVAAVGVRQTTVGALEVAGLVVGQELGGVETDAADHLDDVLVAHNGDVEGLVDGGADGVGGNAELEGLTLLLGLGEDLLEEGREVLGDHTFGDAVAVLERLLSGAEGGEADELHDAAERFEVLVGHLESVVGGGDLLGVRLLEDAVASGGLEEDVELLARHYFLYLSTKKSIKYRNCNFFRS
eukprot:PhM_4_TR1904/c0_g1_i1/m.84730